MCNVPSTLTACEGKAEKSAIYLTGTLDRVKEEYACIQQMAVGDASAIEQVYAIFDVQGS